MTPKSPLCNSGKRKITPDNWLETMSVADSRIIENERRIVSFLINPYSSSNIIQGKTQSELHNVTDMADISV